MQIRPWLLASRPKTLTAAIVPVLVGTSLAVHEGSQMHWGIFFCALLGALLIQIGTNLVNDAADFERGTDTAGRLGPLRVTQAGMLSSAAVMRGAWISFVLAALAGVPLVLRGGLPLLGFGVASILAGYVYTGGPYPLAYHGLGELFVMFFFGVVAVGGSHYLQTLELAPSIVPAGLAVGLLATVILAINNLRDLPEDLANGKRTLAVRFGGDFAKGEIAFAAIAPFLLALCWWNDRKTLSLLPLLALPLAALVVRAAWTERGRDLNRALGKAAALHAAFGLLFSIGMLMP